MLGEWDSQTGHGSSVPFPTYLALCISSIWMFICILHHNHFKWAPSCCLGIILYNPKFIFSLSLPPPRGRSHFLLFSQILTLPPFWPQLITWLPISLRKLKQSEKTTQMYHISPPSNICTHVLPSSFYRFTFLLLSKANPSICRAHPISPIQGYHSSNSPFSLLHQFFILLYLLLQPTNILLLFLPKKK